MIVVFVAGCGDDTESDGVKISLNKEKLFLAIGKSERLIASFDPVDALNVAHAWSTSDAQIATVDETGNVTAVSTGNAVIIARALDGGNTAKCNVTVVDKIVSPTEIVLNDTDIDLVVGETFVLKATVLPANATDKRIVWRSLDKSVATIDDTGKITAHALGETQIEVETYDGKLSVKCNVSVQERGVEFKEAVANDISESKATILCDYSAYGVAIKECGVCYATQPEVTINNTKVVSSQKDKIACTLTNLSPETTYYIRPYLQTEDSLYYGTVTEIKTKGVLITNFKATIISEKSLVLESPAPYGYTTVNVCYGTSPNPKVTDYTAVAKVNSVGKLEVELSGLGSGYTYYVRTYTEEGTLFKYNEDEISVQTIYAKEIPYYTTLSPSGLYFDIHYDFTVLYKDTTNIHIYFASTSSKSEIYYRNFPEGTYYVYSTTSITSDYKLSSSYGFGYSKYDSPLEEYEDDLAYINGGNGKFYHHLNDGYWDTYFNNSLPGYIKYKGYYITFKHIETGIIYKFGMSIYL